MTPEQLKIRELEKKIKRLEMEKEYFKKGYRSLDVGLHEQFVIVDKIKQSYPVSTICDVFELNRSSYKYWSNRSRSISFSHVNLTSKIKAAHQVSGGSAGARTIAGIVTTNGD